MIKTLLEIAGIVIVAMIPASIVIYILSRVQARGWIDAINFYFKSNTNNDEQTEKE